MFEEQKYPNVTCKIDIITCRNRQQLNVLFQKKAWDRCQYVLEGLNKNKANSFILRCVILSCLDCTGTLRGCSVIHLVFNYLQENINNLNIICLPNIEFQSFTKLPDVLENYKGYGNKSQTSLEKIKDITEMVRNIASKSIILCQPSEDFHFIYNEVISIRSSDTSVPVLADFVLKEAGLEDFTGFIIGIILAMQEQHKLGMCKNPSSSNGKF